MEYAQNRKNVDSIWIDFVNPEIGKLERNKYHELYDENISLNWTPILNVLKPLACHSRSFKTIV